MEIPFNAVQSQIQTHKRSVYNSNLHMPLATQLVSVHVLDDSGELLGGHKGWSMGVRWSGVVPHVIRGGNYKC